MVAFALEFFFLVLVNRAALKVPLDGSGSLMISRLFPAFRFCDSLLYTARRNARWWPCKMHEGRVRRVYERRRLVTKPLSFPLAASLWMRELKRNFPAQSGTVYAGPFFLSRFSFFLSALLVLCFFHFTTVGRLSQRGVCLMKLSREGSLSFCSAATGYTPLASSVSRALRCSSFRLWFYPFALFFLRRSWPTFPTLLVAGSLSCTSVSAVVYVKVARCTVK